MVCVSKKLYCLAWGYLRADSPCLFRIYWIVVYQREMMYLCVLECSGFKQRKVYRYWNTNTHRHLNVKIIWCYYPHPHYHCEYCYYYCPWIFIVIMFNTVIFHYPYFIVSWHRFIFFSHCCSNTRIVKIVMMMEMIQIYQGLWILLKHYKQDIRERTSKLILPCYTRILSSLPQCFPSKISWDFNFLRNGVYNFPQ